MDRHVSDSKSSKYTIITMVSLMVTTLSSVITVSTLSHKKAKAEFDNKAVQHKQELKAFRQAWMADCLQHAPPFQCVAIWSQVKPEEFTE